MVPDVVATVTGSGMDCELAATKSTANRFSVLSHTQSVGGSIRVSVPWLPYGEQSW